MIDICYLLLINDKIGLSSIQDLITDHPENKKTLYAKLTEYGYFQNRTKCKIIFNNGEQIYPYDELCLIPYFDAQSRFESDNNMLITTLDTNKEIFEHLLAMIYKKNIKLNDVFVQTNIRLKKPIEDYLDCLHRIYLLSDFLML